MDITKTLLVSVIVPTRNSSATLRECLTSIVNQTYRDIELIVVDNHSSDDTIAIAKQFTSSVYTWGPERSAQVNYGVKVASGEYIYRVDSDFILEPKIIQDAIDTAESSGFAAILIHNSSDSSVSFWARVRKFERDMYQSDSLNVAVRFIRKDVFTNIGGFDEELIAGEDYDLHNRILRQYSIGRISSKELHLGEPRSLMDVIKKHYYYGKNIPLFLKKNKDRGLRQLSPFRTAYLGNYKSFIVNPKLTTGFVIYQAARYIATAIGIIIYKLRSIQ